VFEESHHVLHGGWQDFDGAVEPGIGGAIQRAHGALARLGCHTVHRVFAPLFPLPASLSAANPPDTPAPRAIKKPDEPPTNGFVSPIRRVGRSAGLSSRTPAAKPCPAGFVWRAGTRPTI